MKKWSKSRKICAGVVLVAALAVMVICIIIHNRNRYYINPVSVFVYYEPESELLKICEDGKLKEEISLSYDNYKNTWKYYGYDETTVLLITPDNVYLYSDGKLTSVQKGEWQQLYSKVLLMQCAIVSASAKKLV